jgi:hypothetical protein
VPALIASLKATHAIEESPVQTKLLAPPTTDNRSVVRVGTRDEQNFR